VTASKRSFPVRRAVLVSAALGVCGLAGFQCWDMRRNHLRETRLYREFEDADVIARDLTNGGWVVVEAPSRPGPYRLVPDLIGSPVPSGTGEIRFRARLGRDVIDIGRELPPGQSYWFVPLETVEGRLTYMLLQSKPEANAR
jgi:hypothetical protein